MEQKKVKKQCHNSGSQLATSPKPMIDLSRLGGEKAWRTARMMSGVKAKSNKQTNKSDENSLVCLSKTVSHRLSQRKNELLKEVQLKKYWGNKCW